MATLRNKSKLAAISRDNHEEQPRSNKARDTNVPRNQDDSITQVPEKIDGRVTNKMSQEFNRTENCILGAPSKPNESLLNPQAWVHSGLILKTSRS